MSSWYNFMFPQNYLNSESVVIYFESVLLCFEVSVFIDVCIALIYCNVQNFILYF